MTALADVDADEEKPRKKRKYVPSRRGGVIELDTPQCEPTRHPDCDSRKTIRLLGSSTSTILLSLADVPWLLTWLADAASTDGVPMTEELVLTTNSPAVAGSQVWLAEIIKQYAVQVIMGDFNMALFRAIPEFRSRGILVDVGAWYLWKSLDGEPMSDSCGNFVRELAWRVQSLHRTWPFSC